VAAVNVFYFWIVKCEEPEVFIPTLQQIVSDADPQVSKAASSVYSDALKCANAIKFVGDHLAQSDPRTVKATETAADNNPSVARAVDLTKLAPRVYIQINDENQRDIAKRIQQELSSQQYIVPGIEKVSAGKGENQIRFFHDDREEEKQAERVASVILGLGLGVTAQPKFFRSYEHSPNIRPNHYELWLLKPIEHP